MEKAGAEEKIMLMLRIFCLGFLLLQVAKLNAQSDTTDEVDFSQLEYAGSKTITYANSKIFGLSPQRFVSLGYDYQMPYEMAFSVPGSYAKDEEPVRPDRYRADVTAGLRLALMVPVISSNRFLWQTAANYWRTAYRLRPLEGQNLSNPGLGASLHANGLRNLNWINTIYLPLNEHQFVLFQGQADLSGDYRFADIQPLSSLRYSAALLWGKRPHDRKQWAIGLSRTYRVGNMNYIPVVMSNYTSKNRKWGTEILFPARAHYRRTFSPRSILLMGYELEGQSYRIQNLASGNNQLEIRRGELRFRLDYQFRLTGFFWLGLQAGIRMNYSYDADYLPEGKEFFRGFFGDQSFAMKNKLGHVPYCQLSLNLVSP
jgi:hypothetical protein